MKAVKQLSKTYPTGLAVIVLLASFLMTFPISIVQAEDGDLLWAKGVGGTSDDKGYNVYVDSAGNVYTTGYFQGSVDFDPGSGTTILASAGNNDIFISKMNKSGTFVWAKRMGGIYDDEGWGVFVDSAGNVYITGYFVDTVDFNPGAGVFNLTSEGSSDIFISKLSSGGNFVWARAMGSTSDDYGYSILVDSTGNVYTTGYFRLTVDFDPGEGVAEIYELSSQGAEDIFISKLNSSGTFVWARAIGGGTSDVGLGISQYSAGNLYTTGWFQGTVDFDPGGGTTNLASAGQGSFDIFISKLDSDGNFVWARRMGGASDDRGQGLTVDIAGNVYSTGWFNGTADFDPGTETSNLISAGSADIFVSKLDSSGNFVWGKAMGGSVADVGYGITTDSSGNVYTTGGFGGTADFDPADPATFNIASVGNADIFISKLDSSGNFVWAKGMGGALDDFGYGISLDSSNNVYTAGYFRSTIADFDPATGIYNLSSNGFEDIFVCKLAGPYSSGGLFWPMFLPAIMYNSKP